MWFAWYMYETEAIGTSAGVMLAFPMMLELMAEALLLVRLAGIT